MAGDEMKENAVDKSDDGLAFALSGSQDGK